MNIDELLKAEKVEDLIKKISFEDGLKLLEELVATVENGKLPLQSSVVAYEKGAKLIEFLRSQLEGAEARLKVLQR